MGTGQEELVDDVADIGWQVKEAKWLPSLPLLLVCVLVANVVLPGVVVLSYAFVLSGRRSFAGYGWSF